MGGLAVSGTRSVRSKKGPVTLENVSCSQVTPAPLFRDLHNPVRPEQPGFAVFPGIPSRVADAPGRPFLVVVGFVRVARDPERRADLAHQVRPVVDEIGVNPVAVVLRVYGSLGRRPVRDHHIDPAGLCRQQLGLHKVEVDMAR